MHSNGTWLAYYYVGPPDFNVSDTNNRENRAQHLSPTRPYPTPLSEDSFIRKARPDVQGATTSLKTAGAGAGGESENGEKEPPVHAPFSC